MTKRAFGVRVKRVLPGPRGTKKLAQLFRHAATAMNLDQIRQRSLKMAQSLGYPIDPPPPPLDKPIRLRRPKEVKDRLLALYMVVAAGWTGERRQACAWLDKEKLWHAVSPEERRYIVDGAGLSDQFARCDEAVWALKWALGLLDTLDFAMIADERYLNHLPSPRRRLSVRASRKRMRLRSEGKLVQMYDLALCLHGPARAAYAADRKIPDAVGFEVIAERRRALEWVVTDSLWDDIRIYL
jgi:hypothetical protein